MARVLNKLLIVDVETTCWEGPPPPGEIHEIFEVGVTILDLKELERGARDSIIVRPTQSSISEFCTKLTGMTQAKADAGIRLEDACGLLQHQFKSRDLTWASWGDYDRKQFHRECETKQIQYPFGPTHLNVKNLFAILHRLKHEVSMDAALEMLGLPLEGVHHVGGDDAWNIAVILRDIFRRWGMIFHEAGQGQKR